MPLGIMGKHLRGNALGTTTVDRLSFRGELVPSFIASTQHVISLVFKGPHLGNGDISPEKESKILQFSRGSRPHVLGGLLAFVGDYLTSEAHCWNFLQSKVSDIAFFLIYFLVFQSFRP